MAVTKKSKDTFWFSNNQVNLFILRVKIKIVKFHIINEGIILKSGNTKINLHHYQLRYSNLIKFKI